MYNPFKEKIEAQESDIQLIRGILNGSRKDLERLVYRHQAWIYNIALKMVLDPGDAEDVTQEILIKLITKLSLFDPEKAAFRTWLYRMVVNHVINMKRRTYEVVIDSFEESVSRVAKIPDQSISGLPESRVMVEELAIKCWTAVLLCLNRKHRVVFILGCIFDVTDTVGSEIMETSRSNFRKMLSRARTKIDHFMQQNCGLMDPSNPCHCNRKLNGFIENGFVNPDQIAFVRDTGRKIKEIIREKSENDDGTNVLKSIRQYQSHPFYDAPEFMSWIDSVLQTKDLRRLIADQ